MSLHLVTSAACSEETERAVLAGLFLDSSYLDSLPLHLNLFYVERHRAIFAAAATLRTEGQPIDLRTVQAQLELEGNLDIVGGVAYLYALDLDLPDLGRMAQYVTILEERHLRRRLAKISDDLARDVRDGGTSPDDALGKHQRAIVDILIDRQPAEVSTLGSVALDLAEQYATLSPGHVLGVPTGFSDLDHFLGGFERGRLIVIAGRPGMGKSSLAQQIAEHQHHRGYASMIFSLEMTTTEYVTRSLVRRTGIQSGNMKAGHTSTAQRSAIRTAAQQIALESDLPIDDRGEIRFSQVASVARSRALTGELRVLWIDHLGLLRPDGRHESEVTAVAENTRGLKALAKDLGITVVALHQLNRNCEKRPDKRPMLSDLRDSGSVEQDADSVVFVYRDAVYNDGSDPSSAELLVAKNRDGATGKVDVHWTGEHMKFTSAERRHG